MIPIKLKFVSWKHNNSTKTVVYIIDVQVAHAYERLARLGLSVRGFQREGLSSGLLVPLEQTPLAHTLHLS